MSRRVVDNRIHASNRIDVVRYASSLNGAAQVANDHPVGPCRQIIDGRRALTRARMQYDPMAIGDKRPRGRPAEPVRAAGDEDASHYGRKSVLMARRSSIAR